MAIGNRGFLPVEAVGRLQETFGSIRRIPLFRKNRCVTRKYCLFWQEEKTAITSRNLQRCCARDRPDFK